MSRDSLLEARPPAPRPPGSRGPQPKKVRRRDQLMWAWVVFPTLGFVIGRVCAILFTVVWASL